MSHNSKVQFVTCYELKTDESFSALERILSSKAI